MSGASSLVLEDSHRIELKESNENIVTVPNPELIANVVLVRSFLNKHDVDVKFFIAGGSVFSALNGTPYDDVDVFLESEDDAHKILGAVGPNFEVITPNAVTLFINKKKVQFITRNYGTPDDVLDSFDISCSKIGITSDMKMMTSPEFSTSIVVNTDSLSGDTLRRVVKYSERKGAILSSGLLKKLVKIYCMGFYVGFGTNYRLETVKGCNVLSEALPHFNKKNAPKYLQLLHDTLQEVFLDSHDLMKAYSEVKNFRFHIPNVPSDEFIAQAILRNKAEEFKYYSDRILKVKVKFPELFI